MAQQSSRQRHRVRNWAIALGVLDAIVWALTIRAHLSFHRTGNGPDVMSAGQAMGWIFGALLLIALAILLYLARMDQHYRTRRPPGSTVPRLRR